MLVKDCMTRHPIMVSLSTKAIEAQRVMVENNIRHLPVVGDGKRLEGLVTDSSLSLKPDVLGSLNVWEITRSLADLTVRQVMVPKDRVLTIGPDRTIERAAKMLADNKAGCLLVLDEDDSVLGIVSEIDVLHSYQEMLGLPAEGVRVTVRMPNRQGEFAKLMKIMGQQGWGVMGVGTYPTRRMEGYYDVVVKIPHVTPAVVREVFNQVEDQEVVDIRDVV